MTFIWTENGILVTVGGQPVELTYKEFELLDYLMRNQGIVLSREKTAGGSYGIRITKVKAGPLMCISVLCARNVEESGRKIQTVRGVGYKMEMM